MCIFVVLILTKDSFFIWKSRASVRIHDHVLPSYIYSFQYISDSPPAARQRHRRSPAAAPPPSPQRPGPTQQCGPLRRPRRPALRPRIGQELCKGLFGGERLRARARECVCVGGCRHLV